jgi:hypothetical protein
MAEDDLANAIRLLELNVRDRLVAKFGGDALVTDPQVWDDLRSIADEAGRAIGTPLEVFVSYTPGQSFFLIAKNNAKIDKDAIYRFLER